MLSPRDDERLSNPSVRGVARRPRPELPGAWATSGGWRARLRVHHRALDRPAACGTDGVGGALDDSIWFDPPALEAGRVTHGRASRQETWWRARGPHIGLANIWTFVPALRWGLETIRSIRVCQHAFRRSGDIVKGHGPSTRTANRVSGDRPLIGPSPRRMTVTTGPRSIGKPHSDIEKPRVPEQRSAPPVGRAEPCRSIRHGFNPLQPAMWLPQPANSSRLRFQDDTPRPEGPWPPDASARITSPSARVSEPSPAIGHVPVRAQRQERSSRSNSQ